MHEHYTLKEAPTKEEREALTGYDELVQTLLCSRGITTAHDADVFLNPDYDRDVHDPFLLHDMDRAVARLTHAIDTGEHIGIYTDFDADGIPAGALLHDALTKIGHTRFTNYIPHRDAEGYGFHAAAVDTLATQGVTLIVTADVGISDSETVRYANERGIDVIVTDHHTPPETLPDAVAVVNPQRIDDHYPNPGLSGSGVAFKLVQALFAHAREHDKPWIRDVPEGWEKWLLDLVALATVADMVSLTGENRTLVHFGLLVLRKSRRAGVGALCRVLRVSHAHLTEDDIGFSIAPRINAASRMDSPEKAFALLTTTDDAQAAALARELQKLNDKRKGAVASVVRELNARFAAGGSDDADAPLLVAGNPSWNPALLGLAANSLVDTHGKTVCLWGREANGTIKGSCRSAGDVHIIELFGEASSALSHYGGHEHAGGFSVAHDAVHTLPQALCDAHACVRRDAQERTRAVDALLPRESLSRTHATLAACAPFGMGNPKPVFVCLDTPVQAVRTFGRDNAHTELVLTHDGSAVRAIAFFTTPASFTREPKEGMQVTVLCTLVHSHFAGSERFELHIIDVV